MGSIPESDFKKQLHCPPSEDLAFYRQRNLANRQELHVAAHLRMCDFCSAELQLLSKVPSADHPSECPPMPASLRALAEALLGSERRQGLRWMPGADLKAT